MKINESGEDYLERILMLSKKLDKVRSIDIATDMNYSKPSISIAMKNLKMDGCIAIDDAGSITLTDKGMEIALATFEKHKTITGFFMSLGVSEDQARTDACKIEHVISEESFKALKEYCKKNKKDY